MEARSKILDPSSVPLKQRAKGNIWVVLSGATQVAVYVVILIALFALFLPVINTYQWHQDQRENLQRQKALALQHQSRLQLEIDLLKKNPEYIERIARDKLPIGKPGEVIFRFDPYTPTPEKKQ